jgi:hypothetical protein
MEDINYCYKLESNDLYINSVSTIARKVMEKSLHRIIILL